MCLDNTLLKDEESARHSHVLACNFAKYITLKPFDIYLDSLHVPRIRVIAIAPGGLKIKVIGQGQG